MTRFLSEWWSRLRKGISSGTKLAQSADDLNSQGFAVAVPHEDLDMEKAFQTARDTIGEFIARIRLPAPTQEYSAVKIRVKGIDRNEYLWVEDISYSGDAFDGMIGNDSDLLVGSRRGDKTKVRFDEVYDWMIVDNGKLIGGYTIRVMRSKMTHEQRKEFDALTWYAFD